MPESVLSMEGLGVVGALAAHWFMLNSMPVELAVLAPLCLPRVELTTTAWAVCLSLCARVVHVVLKPSFCFSQRHALKLYQLFGSLSLGRLAELHDGGEMDLRSGVGFGAPQADRLLRLVFGLHRWWGFCDA
jgi:hypothetical protein